MGMLNLTKLEPRQYSSSFQDQVANACSFLAVTKPSAKKTVDIEKGRLREFRPSDKTLFPQRITGNKREISKKPLLFKTLKKKARYDEDLEGPYLLKAHGFWPGHGGPFHMPGREFLKAYNYDEGDQSVLEKRFLTALRATFGKKALEKFNIIKDRSTDASLIAQLVVSAARSSSKSKRALSGSAKLAGWYKQGRQALLADSDSEASEGKTLPNRNIMTCFTMLISDRGEREYLPGVLGRRSGE